MKTITLHTFLAMATLAFVATQGLCATYSRTGDLIGEPTFYTIKKNDRLSGIARQFDMGLVELKAANPGLKTKLKIGQILVIPTQHLLPNAYQSGIVINLGELRLYNFNTTSGIESMPITVGTQGWETPLGETVITQKRKNPTWTPPASIRAQNPKLKKSLCLWAQQSAWPLCFEPWVAWLFDPWHK